MDRNNLFKKVIYSSILFIWALACLIRVIWAPYNMHSDGKSLFLFSHWWYTIDFYYLGVSYLIYTIFAIFTFITASFVFRIRDYINHKNVKA